MFWYRLAALVLCAALFPSPYHTRALSPQGDPLNSLPLSAGGYGPPKPWNRETCRGDSNHPNIHLTFSWGAVHSQRSMFLLFESAKQKLGAILDAGKGDLPIPDKNVAVADSGTGVFIVARPHKIFFRPQPFTYNQIAWAVHLLQRCGLNQGRSQEMWAFVFVAEKHVGNVYIGPNFAGPGNLGGGGRQEIGAEDSGEQ